MKVAKKSFTHHVSVPSNKGVRVDRSVTVRRPGEEVYRFWRRFENLARFLRHVESVMVQDELHSHWRVKAAGDKVVEWDAEIIEDHPNEMVSWRSLPGADVDNAGSVWFTRATGGRGTVVKVSLKYLPPAGKLATVVAKLLGQDAKAQIEEDLLRVKSLLETGEIPTTEGQSRGEKGGRR